MSNYSRVMMLRYVVRVIRELALCFHSNSAVTGERNKKRASQGEAPHVQRP